MKTRLAMIWVLAASALCLPAFAAAQGTVNTFDQLGSRLKVGNTVRVTDTEGQEVNGKLTELHDASLTVDSGVPTTFEARRVRLIQHGTKSYLRSVLWGMLIGGVAVGVAGASSWVAYNGEGGGGALLYYGAIGVCIGAGGGAVVGAALPAKWEEVYRAPGASGSAHLSIGPMIAPRTKGVLLSFSF
jgi:hypothetical protein